MLLTLFGISLVSFMIIYLSPVDPVRAMFSVNGVMPSEAELAVMRADLGLDRSFVVQYFDWLSSCICGDFGTSIIHGKPVGEMLSGRVMPTIKLTMLAVVLMLVIAIPVGILSAMYQNKFVDYVLRGFTFMQISMPGFWAGLIFLYVFGLRLGWFNIVSTSMGLDKMFLPAFTLAFSMSGKYARQVRTAILEEKNQDYVVGAKARGISEGKILLKYILPNACLPLITLLGLSIGSLLGGTAVVEVIFSYPALGSLALSAITSMDYPLIQGSVLWVAVIYMLVNLGVDILYERLDPRVKATPRN